MKWYTWALYILWIFAFFVDAVGFYLDGSPVVGTLSLLALIVTLIFFIDRIRSNIAAKKVVDIKPTNLPEQRPVSPYEHANEPATFEPNTLIKNDTTTRRSCSVLKKEFHVVSKSTGELYTVKFSNESGKVQAHCSCRAGIFGTLCKHVIGIMETDDDVKLAMQESGQANKWNHYLNNAKDIERRKKELAKEKKAFAKDLLYSER